jgi:DNA-binding XRE family transcriptional regulator
MKAAKPKDPRYPPEIKTVGDELRAKRMDLGLLQKEVAGLIGVTEDTVCYWENNRVAPSRKLVKRVQHFLTEAS